MVGDDLLFERKRLDKILSSWCQPLPPQALRLLAGLTTDPPMQSPPVSMVPARLVPLAP